MNQHVYATDNGFYTGDRVQTPTGEYTHIDTIIARGICYIRGYGFDELNSKVTLVELTNGELWLDFQLTRVTENNVSPS